jgi:tRNA uridine 5-carbamoylmethylation protein Kti12
MKEIVKKANLLEPVDVDKISIKMDHYFPSAYIIDLPLDSAPDHVWQDIFEFEWKSSRHLWDRKLFVIGDKLRLITTADEIESKLGWVKKIIEQTNAGIDEYNQETETRIPQIEEEAKKQELEAEAQVGKIRETLRRMFEANI